jgi:hypothetical protein
MPILSLDLKALNVSCAENQIFLQHRFGPYELQRARLRVSGGRRRDLKRESAVSRLLLLSAAWCFLSDICCLVSALCSLPNAVCCLLSAFASTFFPAKSQFDVTP